MADITNYITIAFYINNIINIAFSTHTYTHLHIYTYIHTGAPEVLRGKTDGKVGRGSYITILLHTSPLKRLS